MKLRLLLNVLVGLFLTVSTVQAATECTAVFPDGLSSNSNGGEIKLKSSSRINNSPDSILDTKSISGSGSNSCPPSSCSSSGNPATSIDYNSFPGNSNYELDEGDSETLSPGNYKKGTIKKNATLRLTAGDYTFKEEFKLEEGARIVVNSGPVRLLVKKTITIEKDVVINSGGSASNLLIYSRDKIEVKEDASVTAFLYSKGDYKQEKNTTVNGAASGKKVELEENAVINFQASEQASADFGDLCEGGGGPVPQISVADTTVVAGDSALFSITLEQSHSTDISIDYATANGSASAGSDYTASSGTATILQGNTSVTVSIPTASTGSGTFNLNLRNASVGEFTDDSAQATIELAQITVADISVDAGDNATFTISLAQASTTDITVDYATANGSASAGSDYTSSSGTVTIPQGDTSVTVNVPTSASGSGTFNLNLSNASTGVFTDASAQATIFLVQISVADTSANAGSNATFTISLTEAYTTDITLDYATTDGTATGGTDYTATSGTATISQGATAVTVNVPTSASGLGTFNLNLSNASAGVFTDASAQATILDVTAPVLDSVTAACTALTTVSVTFSEAIDNTTGSDTGNYALVNTDTSNSVPITTASVSSNTVTLTTASLASGSYQLTINNLEDTSGNVITSNSQAGFSLDCDVPDPRLEYRFDQCDLASGVEDSANSYDGTANNTDSTDDQYLINRSLDLSVTDTSDYITVPRSAVNGLNDFSIATWIKTGQSPSQQEIFQALGSSTGDDEIEIYLVGSSQVHMNVGNSGNTVSAGKTLTDNNWHHLLVTRTGRDMCLYVDGNLANCHDDGGNSSVSIGNSSSVIIGQEQDSYGGSFDSSQSFKGYLDEFKIYSSALNASHANQIYSNELAGKNADNTSRDPVNCVVPLPDPRMEYRFDECSLTSGVTDSAGSYSGTATDADSTDSEFLINRALDLSATGTSDYISVPRDAVNGLDDFSISTWIKTNQNPSQQEIFQALGSNDGDDEIEIYLVGSNQVQMNVGNTGNTVSAGKSLTDNAWHHLLITRTGSDMCLYVDGSLANCHDDGGSSQISVSNSSSVIIGQEQDAFGGDFDSTQSWKGYIDEFKIYASRLDANHAAQIYTNELAGKNADDTARDPVSCSSGNAPILEYRFDQCEITNQILDSSTNAYHGTPNLAPSSSNSRINRSLNLISDSTDDWVSVPKAAVDGLTDFTIAFWFNSKAATGSHNRIFQALGSSRNDEEIEISLRNSQPTQLRVYVQNVRKDINMGVTLTDETWKHLTMTRTGNTACFFINGGNKQCQTGFGSSAISVPNEAVFIGQRQRQLGGSFTNTSEAYEGYLDEFKIYDQALDDATVSQIYSYELAGNNYDNSPRDPLSCSFPTAQVEYQFDQCAFEGTVTDTSSNGRDGEVFGAISSDDNVINRSINLLSSGTADWVGVPRDSLQGLNEVSVSLWFKTAVSGHRQVLLQALGSSNSDEEFELTLQNSSQIRVRARDREATLNSSVSLTDDSWHHLVLTRVGTVVCLYIDKNLQTCNTSSRVNSGLLDVMNVSGTSTVVIGQEQDQPGGGFNSSESFEGYLDEFKIYPAVLDLDQVEQIYDNEVLGLNVDGSSRSVLTCGDPTPRLEYRFDQCSLASEDITDSSGNGYDATPNHIDTTEESAIERALNMISSGTDHWADVPKAVLDGLDGLSVTFWLKTTFTGQQTVLQALGDSTGDEELEIRLQNSTTVRIYARNNDHDLTSPVNLADDSWHHIAISRLGSYVCLYVDGELAECENGVGAGVLDIPNDAVVIGQDQESLTADTFNNDRELQAYLDELKIYGQVLSAEFIEQIYDNEVLFKNVDGSDRAALNCPFPSVQLDYRFDSCSFADAGVVDNTGNFNGTAEVTETIDLPNVINRAADLSITGSNDRINIPDSALQDLDAFTISTWVQTSVSKTTQTIFHALGSGAGDEEVWLYLNNSSNVIFAVGDRSTTMAAGQSLTDGDWHHISVTRYGSYACLYVNGALQQCTNSVRSSSVDLPNSNSVYIGQRQSNFGSFSSSSGLDGYLDEFKIFPSELSASDVQQIYNNELADNNYDGSDRDPSSCTVTLPQPLANYYLDERAWQGAAGEVTDSAPGGSFNASVIQDDNGTPAIGQVSNEFDGKICRAAQIGLNTSSNRYYAIDTGIDVNSDIGNSGSISLWYRSDTAWGSGNNRALFDASYNSPGGSGQDKYFFLSRRTNGALRFGFEDDADDGVSFDTPAFTFAADEWVHVLATWDMSTQLIQVFVNGNREVYQTFSRSGQLGELLSLYVGDNRSTYIAGGATDDSAEGDIDEVIVFDQALDSVQAATIYQNQNQGLNYDGTERSCGAVAEWRFDEGSWDGSLNEILDSSGYENTGQAESASPIYPGAICHAGAFNGSNAYISALDLSTLQSTASLSFWLKTTQTGSNTSWSAPGVAGVEQSGGEDDIAWGWLDASGRIGITVGNDYTTTKSNTVVNDDQWHHVVLTRDADSGDYQIFIDGVLDKSGTGVSGDIGNSFSSLGRIENSGSYFEGILDEVLIFAEVLDASKVSSIRSNTLAGFNWDGTERGECAPVIDHYSISHSESGVTCLSEPITITAHDVNHDAVDAAESTLTISTSSGRGDWLSIASGGGSLNNGDADDGIATYTFASGSDTVTLRFSHTIEEDVSFNVTDGDVTENSGNAGPADDPVLSIKETGFRFIDSAGNELIPSQIAAKTSGTFYLQAIRADDNDSSVCTAAFSGVQTIQLAAQCDNPTTCVSGQSFSVIANQTKGIALNPGAPAAPASFTDLQMNFDAEAKAPFTLNYNDAGLMQLHARYTVPETSALMEGISNQFVVRPFAFGFPSINAGGTDNPAGDETSGDGFTSAGSNFDVTINAYVYQSADDGNGDGIPDEGADVTNNDVTPNFTGNVNLSIDSFTPASGVEGSLTGNLAPLLDTYTNRSGADVDVTLQYSEVGSVSILAQMDDYLGDSNADIQSVATKIGRFYPDYFAISNPIVISACSGFNYMQQPYAEVGYRLEARSATDTVTENYDGDFYTVGAASIELLAESNNNGDELSARLNTSSGNPSYDSSISLSNWESGVVERSTESTSLEGIIFTRSGGASGLPDGPYEQVQLGIRVESGSEADSRDFKDDVLNMKADSAGDCDTSCDAVSVGGAQNQRYGRIMPRSIHGDGSQDVPLPIELQYWDGSKFALNADDSCSGLEISSSKSFVQFNGTGTVLHADDTSRTIETMFGNTRGDFANVTSDIAVASGGAISIIFIAPGTEVSDASKPDSFNIDLIQDGGNSFPNWLLFDWNNDGSAAELPPPGILTFGRARGNDRMIFWQERYR